MPSSILKGELFEWMVSDGILVAVTRGSRKSYRARDGRSLRDYIAAHFDISVIGNEKYIIFGKMEYIRISNNDTSFSVTMVHRFR